MLPARPLWVPLLGAAALTLAACGSSRGPSASAQTGSGPGPGAVTFAKCMRGHGVPQFPDPKFLSGGAIAIPAAAGPSASSPAFRHARQVCGRP